ncbi:MAG: hypothetical protein K0R38_3170 [Polyangiaceae bacterium]|jgi:hypothetical protein|nr:hypothetical protein [Polyangiaceae bacterium]
MASSTSLRWVAMGVALALGLGVWLYPTDEKHVKAAAEAIVSAANESSTALSAALDEHALPGVRISVAELPEAVEGKSAIVSALSQAEQLAQKLHFRAESIEVTVEGNRARLTADLITTLHPELPELRRPRATTALFEKRAGNFRLASADIGPERLDQPEARP